MFSDRESLDIRTPTLACCQVLGEFYELGFDSDAIYEWANHIDPLFRRNRMQILSTLPVFVPVLAFASESLACVYMAVETMIDRGDLLIEGMAEIIGVTRICVRQLLGKSPAVVGKEWVEQPISLLRALDLLKPGSFPKKQSDWLTLWRFWEGCGFSFDLNYVQTKSAFSDNANQFMEHVFTGLCTSEYAITHKKLAEKWHGELGRLSDLNDYRSFIAQWCKSGAGLGALNTNIADQAKGIVSVELLKRYTAKSLIKQSEHWHRLMHQFSAAFHGSQSAWEWPGLPGLPWHYNNLSAVALTNPKSLVHEGERMSHCVASYAESCLLGKSHIISIRNNENRSCSTVEIYLDRGPESSDRIIPQVAQHRAFCNEEPDSSSIEFVERLIERWGQDDFQDQLKALVEFHATPERQEFADVVRIESGTYSAGFLCKIASQVLPNYESDLSWLKYRLLELEGNH